MKSPDIWGKELSERYSEKHPEKSGYWLIILRFLPLPYQFHLIHQIIQINHNRLL